MAFLQGNNFAEFIHLHFKDFYAIIPSKKYK